MSSTLPTLQILPIANESKINLKIKPEYNIRGQCLKNLTMMGVNEEIGIILEAEISKKNNQECQLYHYRNYSYNYELLCRHIINNLHPELVKSLNNGTLQPDHVVNMTPQELRPDVWEDLIKKKNYRDDVLNKPKETMSDHIYCWRCHRNKCTFFERQDRCADEPMTLHITCLHCGNKWKQN